MLFGGLANQVELLSSTRAASDKRAYYSMFCTVQAGKPPWVQFAKVTPHRTPHLSWTVRSFGGTAKSVYSVADWALGHDLFSELSERNSAVLVLIHFLDDLGCLLLADVEAAGLNQSLEFLAGEGSIGVHVQGVVCLVDVEVGHAGESLTDGLSGDLGSEVGSPDGAELKLGVWHVAVIASVKRVAMVGATALDHAGVVGIKGEEGVRELTHVESTVTGGVVTRDEEVKLLAGGEDTDGGESLSELNNGDVSGVVRVEDLESIGQVKVGLEGKGHLLSFDVVLDTDEVAETIDKLVLVSKVEGGSAGWAGVARLRGHSRGR